MDRRVRLLLVCLAVLALVATGIVVVATRGGGSESVVGTVDAKGGVVGKADGLAQVDVPAGATTGATVTIGPGSAPDTSGLTGYVTAVGPIVDITTTAPLPNATVRLPFDVTRQLPPKATVRNAFVAVFNDFTESWLPLDTSYDETARHLTATAPHFSRFRIYVIKVDIPGWLDTITGTELFQKLILDAWKGAKSDVFEAFNGEQRSLDGKCAALVGWQVTSAASEITGCVAQPGNEVITYVRSTLRYPIVINVPDKLVPQPPIVDAMTGEQDGFDLLIRMLYCLTGQSYIPARGIGAVAIPVSEARPGAKYTLELGPSVLPFAMRAIMTAFGLVAGRPRLLKDIAEHEAVRKELINVMVPGLTREQFKTSLSKILAGGGLLTIRQATAAAEAADCMKGLIDVPGKVFAGGEDAWKAVMSAARKCLTDALDHIKKTAKEILEIALVIPDLVQLGGALFDLARKQGLHEGTKMAATVSRAGAVPDGSYFVVLSDVDATARTATFQKAEWLEGAAAYQACLEEHSGNAERCENQEYKVRVTSTDKLTLPLAENVAAREQYGSATCGNSKGCPITVERLAQMLDQPNGLGTGTHVMYVDITVRSGAITQIIERDTV